MQTPRAPCLFENESRGMACNAVQVKSRQMWTPHWAMAGTASLSVATPAEAFWSGHFREVDFGQLGVLCLAQPSNDEPPADFRGHTPQTLFFFSKRICNLDQLTCKLAK